MKYEVWLEDDEVTAFVNDLRNGLDGPRARRIADEIEGQIKVPIPTGLGAVVRTTEGLFVLADGADARHWFLSGSAGSGDWRTPGELGRILEVLSDGVEE